MDGRIALGARFVAAIARIFADRVEESLGRALPRTREQLAQANVVNGLVRDFPASGSELWPLLRSVRLSGVEFESSNCTNFLVDLEFASEFEREGPSLPKSAYVKLPCAELATRIFANAIGFWETEVAFCEGLASRMPIRVPEVYAVARRGARFVLLLENLHDLPGTKLFSNREMAAGTTIERAQMCLRSFAQLHAGFSDLGPEEREALLPNRLHTYLAPGGSEKSRALNAAAIEPAHRAAPDLFDQKHVAIARRAIEKWDALMDRWYSGSLTLIHGDSHLANCFEYPSPDGPRMGMLDFQGVQWCKGIRDVQYFLINSLEPDLLAEHEQDLIGYYIEALGKSSVRLPYEEAHDQYRAFAFQTLMVAVVSIGLGSLTERDETVRTVLRRSVAAIDRLDFSDWLETLP